MGYRSQVMALIYPDHESEEDCRATYAQLKLLMGTTFKEVSDEFGEDMKWFDDECVLQFDLPDVKWYPSYPGVQMFERMLEAFDRYSDDGLPGYCTEFVRVGEDSGDNDEKYTGENIHYYLQMRRTIDCNV
jgi:hypothetical protein